MNEKKITSQMPLTDLVSMNETHTFLKPLKKNTVEDLEQDYWINTVGDLLQTIANARIETPLEQILGMDLDKIQSLKKEIVAQIPKTDTAALQAPVNYTTGLVLDDIELYGRAFRPDLKIYEADLPSNCSHVKDMPPIMDQGSRGTCVACAATGVSEWYQNREGKTETLSAQHLYCRCKEEDNVEGGGTYIGIAVKILNESGQCTDKTLPYNPEMVPGNEGQCPSGSLRKKADKEAASYRTDDAKSVPAGDILAIKRTLAGYSVDGKKIQGRPLVFGVPLYPSFMGGETAHTGKVLMPLPGEESVGGHAMVLVGYQDGSAPGGGYFIVRNSWGLGWGRACEDGAGYCHIPYAYFEKYAKHRSAFGFYTTAEKAIMATSDEQQTEASQVYFDLGKTVDGRKPVNLPAQALQRHLTCIGSTGSGKTVFCKLVCEQALLAGIPVIAIDPQGDLASMAKTINESDAKKHGLDTNSLARLNREVEPIIFTPESNAGIPICANPFASAYLDGSAKDRISFEKSVDLLAEVLINHLQGLQKTKLSFYQNALFKAMRYAMQSGRLENLDQLAELFHSTPKPLREELNKVLDDKQFMLLKKAFNVLLDSPSRYLFDYGVPLDVDLLIGRKFNPENKTRLSILYLNSLNSPSDKFYFMGLLLENIYQWMLSNPTPDGSLPQLILFIDEIGMYVPPQNKVKPVCKDILIKIFKQARKYGISCLCASQSPGDFDYHALGQINTMNIGRLRTEQEHSKIEGLIKSDFPEPQDNSLFNMGKGEFLLRAPDVFDEAVHYKSHLTSFGLGTLGIGDIEPYISGQLRDRFSQFCRLPDSKTEMKRSIEEESSEIGDISQPEAQAQSEEINALKDRIASLISENQLLKNTSQGQNPLPQESSELEDIVLTTIKQSNAAPDVSELMELLQDGMNLKISRKRLGGVLSGLVEEGSLEIVKEGRKHRYHPKGEAYLSSADIFEKVLYPEKKYLIAEARAEKEYSEYMEMSFLGKKLDMISYIKLINYPVWKFVVEVEKKEFFSGKSKAVPVSLYMDALTQKMMNKSDDKITFKRNLEPELHKIDDALKDFRLTDESPCRFGLFPKNYETLISKEEALKILLIKYPIHKVQIKEARLFFLPFWLAEISPKNKGERPVKCICIDALSGERFIPPVLPKIKGLSCKGFRQK